MVGLALTLLLADGTPFVGKCPVCMAEGKTSTVEAEGFGTVTLAYCGGGHYDETGEYHAPKPCNTASRSYRCSNGHEFGTTEEAW